MERNQELQAALEVVRGNFQQEINDLASINVGSRYRTKSQITTDVINKAQELRDVVVYGFKLIEFINQGGTFEQFIDNQLEFITSFDQPGHDPRSKAHWVKMLYKLYPDVADKLTELTNS